MTAALKDLGAKYGFEVTVVRDYLGLGAPTQTASPSGSVTPSSATTPSTNATPSTTVKSTTALAEVQTLLGDRFPAFLASFGISPNEPMSAILKGLGARYGFEVTAIREYIAALPTP
jgi:hypothetical protein